MGVDKRMDGVLRWFDHVERMENDRFAKNCYVGVSYSVGIPWKRWIDTVKECLKRRGLDVRQARRMVKDRSKMRGFAREECMGHTRLMNP